MSNPVKIITKQLNRSAKDISDEWKRLPEGVRTGITAAAVIGTGMYGAGALGAGGAAAGASSTAGAGGMGAAMGGTGIGVGTGTLAASGAGAATTAATGGGFLGALGSGASAIGSGAMKLGSAINGANPALLMVGGQALAGAMAPEPERQVDVLREQQRIRNEEPTPGLSFGVSGGGGGYGGGGYLGPGPQPSGAYTTAQPRQMQPRAYDMATGVPVDGSRGLVERFDPETMQWRRPA